LARILELNRPHAIAAQLPVTEQHRHRAPCVHAVERFAVADELRAAGIGEHRCVRLEMPLAERGQAQAIRLDDRNVDHESFQAMSPASARVDAPRLSSQLKPTMRSPLAESRNSSSC